MVQSNMTSRANKFLGKSCKEHKTEYKKVDQISDDKGKNKSILQKKQRN